MLDCFYQYIRLHPILGSNVGLKVRKPTLVKRLYEVSRLLVAEALSQTNTNSHVLVTIPF